MPLKHDSSSYDEFYDYYKRQSETDETRARFTRIRDTVMRALGRHGNDDHERRILDVADIGCGAGSQCRIWAEAGHRVHGLDVNQPLLQLAGERAKAEGMDIEYNLGTAAALPWGDCTMDVCLVPELLEHVADWERCLDEFGRVLKPGGVLFLSTNNKLCPVQYEFNLPLYSWYPARLKRRIEALVLTSRPALANYAKYPAINWFTYGSLSAELRRRGFRTLDRFDVMDVQRLPVVKKMLALTIKRILPLRLLAQFFTASTVVLGLKKA